MNLVDQLLKADTKKATELEQGTFSSKRLAKILGEDKAVAITIREIPAKKMNDIVAHQFDSKGNFDYARAYEGNALAVVEGVIDPPLKDEKLREHFDCATPKDLAIKLFGNEIGAISDAIINLSGMLDQNSEQEIKN